MEAPDTETRELTLDETVSLAILLQKDDRLAEAEELYRLVLERIPDHPGALHFAGVLAHQQRRSEHAVALIERSLALAPVVVAAMLESSGLEHAVGDAGGADYRLEFHGRYSHTRDYVGRVLARSGLRPEIAEAELRMEAGAPVAGLIVRATKNVIDSTLRKRVP